MIYNGTTAIKPRTSDKEIRRAYIGENFIYGNRKLRLNTAESPSVNRGGVPTSTSNSNYGIECGGQLNSSPTNSADKWDKNFVRSSATSLSVNVNWAQSTTINNKILVSTGIKSNTFSSSYANGTVDVYDENAVKSVATSLSSARWYSASSSNSSYALFGGGERNQYYGNSAVVDAYSTSLARSTPTALSCSRGLLSAGTVGNSVLFIGGLYSNSRKEVDIYNSSLSRSTTSLATGRRTAGTGYTSKNLLFVGGTSDSGASNLVDRFSSSFVRSSLANLSTSINYARGNNIEDKYIVFFYMGLNYIDIYDASLVRTSKPIDTALNNIPRTFKFKHEVYATVYNVSYVYGNTY